MRLFRNGINRNDGLTVQQLIDILSKFPHDCKVAEYWDEQPVIDAYAETKDGKETVVYLAYDHVH